ncbi:MULTISPECIES: TetR/AcrR family transcriptional regulator [Actinoplanes]|uniref:TetR/AcrR family transcriptional regulator n=1 Tax=Actinoplanes TaxID=1865 RepID=UPI0005F2A33C|nr:MULTISPECIES: TetR/AcrR family transcriptional regulator [Actinoplanes]GLY07832.1 TetR family transcriptional regulator [Actinoplanes sp. NBRC 101535]
MKEPTAPPARDLVRSRLVDVAAHLLATEGPEAVTTRSVALAAGVQAPSIYRLFGDKNGLLEAVAEHGFASYVAQKPVVDAGGEPVTDLRAGWDLHVGFGLANPALFRLMHTTRRTPAGQATVDAGTSVLRQRVRRVARAGRLRVPEQRAVDLIHAAGTGVVFALIDQPEDQRDETLAELAWEAVCGTILLDAQPAGPSGPATAAVTMRAALPDVTVLSPAEIALLADWLDRITDSAAG